MHRMTHKTLYLTIDDSPTSGTEEILAFLKEKEISTVFFCRGDRLEKLPEIATKIVKSGHILGNHAYSHRHFSNLKLKDCFDEIVRTHHIIDNIYREASTIEYPKVFRFPYGDKGDYKYGHHLLPFKEAFLLHRTRFEKIKSELYHTFSRKFFINKKNEGIHRKIEIQKYLVSMEYVPFHKSKINYNFLRCLVSHY